MDSPQWPPPPPPSTGRRAAAARLADATRRIIDRVARVTLEADELERAADEMEQVAAHLESTGEERSFWGFAEAANAGDTHAFFDRSPIIGHANPLAPPIEVELTGDRVFGRVTFGTAYEGPPGCVHGGFLAAAFDEGLGMAQSTAGNPGMTGTLTVRYRSPTPLHEDLRFEGWVDRVDGRKIFAQGTCHVGDRLTAEAEGVFISVDFLRFAELAEGRQAGSDRPEVRP